MSRKSHLGFSLIEVIVALALTIVTIVIFGAAVSSTPLTKTAKYQNIAYHVAEKKLEELRNTDFNSLPPSASFKCCGARGPTGTSGW